MLELYFSSCLWYKEDILSDIMSVFLKNISNTTKDLVLQLLNKSSDTINIDDAVSFQYFFYSKRTYIENMQTYSR